MDFHWSSRTAFWRTDVVVWFLVGVLTLAAQSESGVHAQPTPDDSTQVQVRLHYDHGIESAQLTLARGALAVLLPSGGAPALQLQQGETATLGRRHRDVYLRRGGAGLYARSLYLAPDSEAVWSLEMDGRTTHSYTGGLSLLPADSGDALQLVNRVPLHDYVASVVAGEYGLGSGEGAKAMAVVARTYALSSTQRTDSEYDHVDGTASQVYRGVDVITDASRQAARHTQGEILTYEGTPIQAVYFASSGGNTANNEHVWTNSGSIPYLRGKKDPYDQSSPNHRWSARVNRRALLQALSRHQNASVEGFLLGDRTPDGRLATIDVLRSDGSETEIEAATFRSAVNEGIDGNPLKSTWFDARRDGSEYVFEGRGYGHGVGLNQWGAYEMAQQGHSYREILRYYYTGVQIEQLDEVQPSIARPPVAQDSTTAPPDSTVPRVGW